MQTVRVAHQGASEIEVLEGDGRSVTTVSVTSADKAILTGTGDGVALNDYTWEPSVGVPEDVTHGEGVEVGKFTAQASIVEHGVVTPVPKGGRRLALNPVNLFSRSVCTVWRRKGAGVVTAKHCFNPSTGPFRCWVGEFTTEASTELKGAEQDLDLSPDKFIPEAHHEAHTGTVGFHSMVVSQMEPVGSYVPATAHIVTAKGGPKADIQAQIVRNEEGAPTHLVLLDAIPQSASASPVLLKAGWSKVSIVYGNYQVHYAFEGNAYVSTVAPPGGSTAARVPFTRSRRGDRGTVEGIAGPKGMICDDFDGAPKGEQYTWMKGSDYFLLPPSVPALAVDAGLEVCCEKDARAMRSFAGTCYHYPSCIVDPENSYPIAADRYSEIVLASLEGVFAFDQLNQSAGKVRCSQDPTVHIATFCGSTAAGSSGAPILDDNGLVVGILSGALGDYNTNLITLIPDPMPEAV